MLEELFLHLKYADTKKEKRRIEWKISRNLFKYDLTLENTLNISNSILKKYLRNLNSKENKHEQKK